MSAAKVPAKSIFGCSFRHPFVAVVAVVVGAGSGGGVRGGVLDHLLFVSLAAFYWCRLCLYF